MAKRRCTKCTEYRKQIVDIADEITSIKNQNPITIDYLKKQIASLKRQLSGVMAVNRSVNDKLDLANIKIKRRDNLQAGSEGNFYL